MFINVYKNVDNKIRFKEDDLNNLFSVLVPSPDGKMDVSTIINLYDVSFGLNKKPMFVQSMATGLLFARTEIFSILNNITQKIMIRGLMIDSDIVIPMSSVIDITKRIKQADNENFSFVIPYPIPNGASVYVKEKTIRQVNTIEELDKMKVCDASGLGFYYGDLPLTYRFRNDNKMGEDINFFLDNDIKPKVFSDIEILHNKPLKMGIRGNYW